MSFVVVDAAPLTGLEVAGWLIRSSIIFMQVEMVSALTNEFTHKFMRCSRKLSRRPLATTISPYSRTNSSHAYGMLWSAYTLTICTWRFQSFMISFSSTDTSSNSSSIFSLCTHRVFKKARRGKSARGGRGGGGA